MAHLLVDALFRAGHDFVVLDATNVTQQRRDEWARAAEELEASFATRVVDTSPEECIRRAREEGDTDIIPVIERMAREWDLPRPASWGTVQ